MHTLPSGNTVPNQQPEKHGVRVGCKNTDTQQNMRKLGKTGVWLAAHCFHIPTIRMPHRRGKPASGWRLRIVLWEGKDGIEETTLEIGVRGPHHRNLPFEEVATGRQAGPP